jgi:enoyl-CoA hydratase/3-hydroxyacyl-CoA dehydrogenase
MSSPGAVERVAVVGAGVAGREIARAFAAAGYEVTLTDPNEETLTAALEGIEEGIRASSAAHDTDVEAALGRIETTTDAARAFSGIGIVVEAGPGDVAFAREAFTAADGGAPEEAVLATNTSTVPLADLAAATDRLGRVVGMRFSTPIETTAVVEVVRGERTSEATVETVRRVVERLGRTPIVVECDVPGSPLDRLALRFRLEAVRQVDAGDADVRAVDAAARRVGLPTGPFEALDLVGLDLVLGIARSLRERGVPLHVPALLSEKVESGDHGPKTGRGFYDYPGPGEYRRPEIPRERRYEFDPKALFAPAVNEAAWLLDEGISTVERIDETTRVGMGWPRGLLAFADEYGIDRLVGTLGRLRERSEWEEYDPHPRLRGMVEADEVGLASGAGFHEHEYERERFETVRYERREGVAWITLDRPERLNALDSASWAGLETAFERAEADQAVRATVLRGEGRAFCAGDDIAEIREWGSREEADEALRGTLGSTVATMREHPKPVIAAVDGVANGGGCELVLLSDLAVASRGSDFALPEARIGALPPIALTYGRASLGKKALMELALTGEQFPASEAESMGVVNHVVGREQVEDVARELARSTASSGPESVATIKDLWASMEDDLLDRWFDEAMDALAERVASEEAEEGLSAFLEKRSAEWE